MICVMVPMGGWFIIGPIAIGQLKQFCSPSVACTFWGRLYIQLVPSFWCQLINAQGRNIFKQGNGKHLLVTHCRVHQCQPAVMSG